jgi:hypothetical protein
VRDTPRTLARFTKQRGNHGGTGYPQIRMVTLVACGTRTVIDAVFGPTTGETTYTPPLFRSLRSGMILVGDRNFGAQDLTRDIAATGADVLIRLKNGRRMPILAQYPDGSYLSILGGLWVRVIEAQITIATTAGQHPGVYRLATTFESPPAAAPSRRSQDFCCSLVHRVHSRGCRDGRAGAVVGSQGLLVRALWMASMARWPWLTALVR